MPVWQVTVPPAVILLVRYMHYDWTTRCGSRTATGAKKEGGKEEDGMVVRPEEAASDVVVPSFHPQVEPHVGIGQEQHELQDLSSRAPTLAPPLSAPPLKPHTAHRDLLTALAAFGSRATGAFPTVAHIAERLPVVLVPFALLMFVLVQGLSTKGWVKIFARWWAAWVGRTGVVGAARGMALLSCLLCNVSSSVLRPCDRAA